MIGVANLKEGFDLMSDAGQSHAPLHADCGISSAKSSGVIINFRISPEYFPSPNIEWCQAISLDRSQRFSAIITALDFLFIFYQLLQVFIPEKVEFIRRETARGW